MNAKASQRQENKQTDQNKFPLHLFYCTYADAAISRLDLTSLYLINYTVCYLYIGVILLLSILGNLFFKLCCINKV